MALLSAKRGIPIERSERGNEGVSVYVQDQTTEAVGRNFARSLGNFSIVVATIADTRSFTATPGHGIVVGDTLQFDNEIIYMQCKAQTVVGDVITIDTPFNHSYSPTDIFTRYSVDLRTNGSVTPVLFSVAPLPGQTIDVTRIALVIESAQAMDFTQFGSIAALINGCVLRVKRAEGEYRNLLNFKTNGDFIEEATTPLFQDKTGGGGFGFTSTLIFAGQENRGVVIRLDGTRGEQLELIVQDNLSAGLTKFQMRVQGSEIQN
jgi:hypothetical protein